MIDVISKLSVMAEAAKLAGGFVPDEVKALGGTEEEGDALTAAMAYMVVARGCRKEAVSVLKNAKFPDEVVDQIMAIMEGMNNDAPAEAEMA